MSRLILAGLALVPFAAHADKLVVAPFSTGEGATEVATTKFQNLLGEELKKDTTLDLVARPQTRAPVSAKKGPSAEAVAALKAGKQAYDELKFDEAVPQLRTAIAGLLADPASADFEVISDALIKLAAGAFRMGEEKEAKATLYELARLAPSFEMPAGFPPVFQKEFEKAKKRVDKQPRGQLVVEAPPGSTAYIDGRDLGLVPVTEENVSAGVHYVRVDGGKGQVYGEVVDVKGQQVKVKASYGGAPASGVELPRLEAALDDAVASKIAAYTRAAQADWALVGVVYRSSDAQLTCATALFSVKKQAFVALKPVAFDTDVLTANTEAFKLAQELSQRVANLGTPSPLPIPLVTKAQVAIAATKPAQPEKTDDVEIVAPKRRGALLPKPVEVRAIEGTSTVLDDAASPQRVDASTSKPAEASKGVPAWVWVVTGIAVAAGAGVGGYFVVREVTRPVTGTVNASW